MLLAEQNARLALEVGDWHYIIGNGRIRFAGDSATVLSSEEITTQYLGVTAR